MRNLLVLLLIFTFSCSNIENDNQKNDKKVKTIDLNLIEFTMSECMHECERDSGKVISKTLSGDTLAVKLGHWFNCSYGASDIKKSYNLSRNILDIFIIQPPAGFDIEKNGDTTYYYEATDCNCFYEISFELKNVKSMPTFIRINKGRVENFMGYH